MTSAIHSYHAHIYYDVASTRSIAEVIRDRIDQQFAVRLGRWHDKPIGPHPSPMYQVAFMPDVFPSFVPWLMLHRTGLTVLIHPNTGAPRDDHMVHAMWMGGELPLIEAVLPLTERLDTLEMDVNTRAGR